MHLAIHDITNGTRENKLDLLSHQLSSLSVRVGSLIEIEMKIGTCEMTHSDRHLLTTSDALSRQMLVGRLFLVELNVYQIMLVIFWHGF